MSDSNLHLQLNRERFEISEAFLEKYNRPGPRYTSYPTAPVWQDNFGPDDLEQFYASANAARTPVSLYMHLPFCESLCLFCACNVVITKDHSVAPPYIEILEREIEHVGKFVSRDRPIVQFHWGGGTPTYLTPEQMEQLFGYTAERFNFEPDAVQRRDEFVDRGVDGGELADPGERGTHQYCSRNRRSLSTKVRISSMP